MLNRIILLFLFLVVSFAHATKPPTKEQLKKYKEEGTLQEKVTRLKELSLHRFNPALVKNFTNKHASTFDGQLKAQSMNQQERTPLDGHLQSTGTPKILVLLVEFQDYVHSEEINSRAYIENRIFGEGDPSEYPDDSLRNFYLRSSYNKLDLQGNVLDWYQTDYNRPVEGGSESESEIMYRVITDTINYHDAQGHDFSQYDNDGDGDIDYLAVIWAGPPGAWASLWWGSYLGYFDQTFSVDGKTIDGLSWQELSMLEEQRPFSPDTLIHETGHALGLPDLYDYDQTIGPGGGVGLMDQMSHGRDHNSFSKYILGWLTPEVVSGERKDLSLLPLSANADSNSVLLKKDGNASTKWDEFFIAEYRSPQLNDHRLTGEGLVIWHVDARISEFGSFENNNSYSDHKLIRLVQADGLEQIEKNLVHADRYDLFTTGDEFSTNTRPQSLLNNGEHSGVVVNNIKVTGEKIELSAQVYSSPPKFSVNGIDDLGIIKSNDTMVVAMAPDTLEVDKVEVFTGDKLIHTFSQAPYELVINDQLLEKGSQEIRVVVTNKQGEQSTERKRVLYMDDKPTNLFVNITDHNDELLTQMLSDSGLEFVYSDYIVPLSVEQFPVVHINFGWQYPAYTDSLTIHTVPEYELNRQTTPLERERILAYVKQGGKLILEGQRLFGIDYRLREALGIQLSWGGVTIESVTGSNLYGDKEIQVDLPITERLFRSDFLEEADANKHTTLLTVTSWEANGFEQQKGTCALSKTLAEFNSKLIAANCMTSYFSKKEDKANLYNTYLDFFDIDTKLKGNSLPQVNAGETQTVTEGSSVNLTGVVTDLDGDSLSISWTQLSGIQVTLSNPKTLTPSFVAPEVTEQSTLKFELVASDGTGEVSSTVDIEVLNVNKAPVVSVTENLTVDEGSTVALNASASDADSDELTVSWVQISGTDVSLTDSTTLAASFVAPEVSQSQTLVFEVTVSDGQASTVAKVTVVVEDKTVTNTTTPSSNSPSSASSNTSGGSSGGSFGGALVVFLSLLLVLQRRKQYF